jgi:AmiR/NasT family two-component response regulator
MTEPPRRAVVLLNNCFTLDEMTTLVDYCRSRGYQVVGATRDLIGALQMLAADRVDVVVVDSRRHVANGHLEVISQELAIGELQKPAAPGDPKRAPQPRPRRLR